MDIQDFESTLKRLDLSKADFAKMVGAVYNGVINWNVRGQTPKWVSILNPCKKQDKALFCECLLLLAKKRLCELFRNTEQFKRLVI